MADSNKQQQVMEADEFFAMLEGMEKEEGGGGGGYIGKITFEMGYNSFAAGKSPAERWFPFPAHDQKRREEAKAAAKALGANIEMSYCFKLDRDSVKGRDVSHWQHPERLFQVAHWYDDAKEIIKPALKACGIFTFPYTFWGRLTFMPSVRSEPDDDDPDLVAYPAEVYKNEAEAEAAGGEQASRKDSDAIPGTTAADGPPAWLIEYVKGDSAKGKSPAELAQELGQDAGTIIAALKA